MMTQKQLVDIFMEAKENKNDVGVEVLVPGQEDTEFIIDKNNSIENKLAYYLETYIEKDGALVHYRNENIRIINAFSLNFYMGGDKDER